MAEWLYEEGIGENRAILVDGDDILEAAIELPGTLLVGSVIEARPISMPAAGAVGLARAEDGTELLIEKVPPGVTEGQKIRVEIVREALVEKGRGKRAKARVTDAPLRQGPSLLKRIKAGGHRVVSLSATDPDRFERCGWTELLEEAEAGDLSFPNGYLRLSLTPAMTLFDVDGPMAPAQLAVFGAAAAGRAIRQLGIGGSIGIDLPTLPSREDRQRAAEALDAVLPQPFERTAVNGFGFLQVVRRRERVSIPEILQMDPIGAAARALIRRAERTRGPGERTITAAPPVIARIESNPAWLEELSRRIGAPVGLRPDPSLSISAGHAQSRFA